MTRQSDTSQRIARLLHQTAQSLEKGEPLSPPIVNAAKYALPGSPESDYIYGRFSNPTWEATEAAIATLEGAPCVTFPSGMGAAAAALMVYANPGARLLVPSDGYYNVRLLIDDFIAPLGLEVTYRPTRELDEADLSAFDIVWLETPSNPGLDVCDIAAISQRARTAGARVIVDNTTATPFLQRPLDLGADMVAVSDTKAMAGHSDLLFGHIASHDEEALARARDWRKLSGSTPGPFESWLVYRGLMTLELRLERMCTNAEQLAELFTAHRAVESVRYPGLADDPSHALAAKQMERPGFVIGVSFASEDKAEQFLGGCPMVFEATSFGGIQTSGERRARWGDAVAPGYVRLSAGCEPTGALIESVTEALDAL